MIDRYLGYSITIIDISTSGPDHTLQRATFENSDRKQLFNHKTCLWSYNQK